MNKMMSQEIHLLPANNIQETYSSNTFWIVSFKAGASCKKFRISCSLLLILLLLLVCLFVGLPASLLRYFVLFRLDVFALVGIGSSRKMMQEGKKVP